MRKAKEKFDGLVERIKSGDNVMFGEMEKLYAEAFLDHFLEKNNRQRERAIANLRRQQREFQQDQNYENDEEQGDSFSNEAIDRQELDYLRNVVETLGVKPSVNKLSNYSEKAIENRNWEMLRDVLSISREGKLNSETLETLAVNELNFGSIDSYKTLKTQFPETEVSQDKINTVYINLLSTGNLDRLENIREETNLPVPEEVCQVGYEKLLSKKTKESVKDIVRLEKATNVRPKKTDAVKEVFSDLFDESEIDIRELDEINRLFGLYYDAELSVLAQKSALNNSYTIEKFEHLWRRSSARISEEDILERYAKLANNENYSQISKLIEITRIAPKEPIFSKTASYVLDRSGSSIEDLRKLVEIAGVNPKLDKNAVAMFTRSIQNWGQNIESLIELSNLGVELDSMDVDIAVMNFLNRAYEGFNSIDNRVSNIYKNLNLKPSPRVSGVRIAKGASILLENINGIIEELTVGDYHKYDPLTPIKGRNLREHNKFKSKAKKLVKDYTKNIKKIKAESEGLEIPNPNPIEDIYSFCLELNLAQALIGHDDYLKLDNLIELTNVKPSENSIRKAVYNHIGRNYNTFGHINNPEGLLEKINMPALNLSMNENLASDIASDLISSSENINSSLNYLKRMTGVNNFSSERLYVAAKNRLINDLSHINISQYDAIKSLGLDINNLDNQEKECIGRRIIGKLMTENKETPYNVSIAEQIVQKTGIVLSAKDEELRSIVSNYFDQGYTKPSRIAKLFNAELDKDQIYRRELELIHSGNLNEAKELYSDTNVHPTIHGAKNFVEGYYNTKSREEVRRRMNFVFGQNSGLV